MKRTGRTLSLKGRVNMASDKDPVYDTYTQIWADERRDFVWRITDLQIGPYSPNTLYRFDGLDVWTMPKEQMVGTDPFALGFEDNRCIAQYMLGNRMFAPSGGVELWGGVEMRSIIDPEAFITRELGFRSTDTATYSYLVTLEEYQTNPIEEVVQLLKTSAQKAGVIDDSSGEV